MNTNISFLIFDVQSKTNNSNTRNYEFAVVKTSKRNWALFLKNKNN